MPGTLPPVPATDDDWLPLGAASRHVGVDPDTLRRWADEGRVEAYATPGGHRRFARGSLDRLIAGRRTGPARPLARLGATTDRLSAAYRRAYGRPGPAQPDPRATVPPTEHDAFRVDGRALVEALVRRLDAGDEPTRRAAEDEAAARAATLARRLARHGVPLADAVALFVTARRPFIVELGCLARRRRMDPAGLATLYEDATAALDRLLVAFVAAYDSEHAQQGPGTWT